MSVTSTIHKVIERIKNSSGTYDTVYRKTLGELVECADGTTVENKVGGIKGIANNLLTTTPGLALDATQGKLINDNLVNVDESLFYGGYDFHFNEIFKSNKRVDIILDVGGFSLTPYVDHLIAYVPQGFRPRRNTYIPMFDIINNVIVRGIVNTDGYVYANSSIASTRVLAFGFWYIP